MKQFLALVSGILLLGGLPVLAAPELATPDSAAPDWRSTAEIQLATPEAEPLRVVIRTKARRAFVYEGKAVVASYAIAVGKAGWETPPGEYKVFSKEVNPVFKNFRTGKIIKPGPDNPLGVRWIGFWTDGKTQLGFHGTNEPELIGQAVSHGCVRMRNKDVVALFGKVSIGTPVTVEP